MVSTKTKKSKIVGKEDKSIKKITVGKIGPYKTSKGFIKRNIKSSKVKIVQSPYVRDFDRVMNAIISIIKKSSTTAMNSDNRTTYKNKLLPRDLFAGIQQNEDLRNLFDNVRVPEQ